MCPKGDPNCKPCPERLPSCRGLPDGDRPVSTALWTSKYITCLHNRTMAVRDCPPGSVFNPVTLQCMSTVSRSKLQHMFIYFIFWGRGQFILLKLQSYQSFSSIT